MRKYLNTIAYSQEVLTFLRKNNPDITIVYLSGSILPKRRKQLIKLIKRNIQQGKRQVVVSTQVVEAGVDIDLDIVYRDFAPMDSINQSAGRCNRNGIKGKGIVRLFNSGKAERIYDGTLLTTTKIILKQYQEVIEESELYQINLAYAVQIRAGIAENSNISQHMIKCMQELQLEDLADAFKLIDEDYPAYNVFIEYNGEARRIWKEYLSSFRIKDIFARKRYLKKLTPKLLTYVTRFPKNKYEPTKEADKNKFLIKEENWRDYYDLCFGFKLNDKNSSIFII